MKIPLVIFPREFGANDTAKLFAEINTLQQPLDNLHELFMQHSSQLIAIILKKIH